MEAELFNQKRRLRTYLTRCIMLAGSLPAGVLLFYLKSATPNRRLKHREYVAVTHEELARATLLTPRQVRNALPTLYKKGWVVAEQHRRGYKTVNHYIVTKEFYEAFESDDVKYHTEESTQVAAWKATQG